MLLRASLLPLLALSFQLFPLPHLSAQTPPSGPLLGKAPDRSQWLITVKDGPSLIDEQPAAPVAGGAQTSASSASAAAGAKETNASAASPTDRQILVTKDKPIYHEQESGANPADRWYTSDITVIARPGVVPDVTFAKRGDGPVSDFPDLNWISPKNYVGTRKIHGTECLIFRGTVSMGSDKVPATACLDAKTRLPLVLEMLGRNQTYIFQPVPTSRLTLPPNIQAQIDTVKKTINAAGARPDRPF